MDPLPPRDAHASLTVRLDRWASILRNYHETDWSLTLSDDERGELSTLCTEAANQIAGRWSRR